MGDLAKSSRGTDLEKSSILIVLIGHLERISLIFDHIQNCSKRVICIDIRMEGISSMRESNHKDPVVDWGVCVEQSRTQIHCSQAGSRVAGETGEKWCVRLWRKMELTFSNHQV